MNLNMNEFTDEDINRGLKALPSQIASQAVKVNDAKTLWDMAKLNLKVERAKSLLKSEGTQQIKGAQADIATFEAEEKMIAKEGEYRLQDIKMEKLCNFFTAIRKAASLRVEEMKSLKDTIGGQRG